MDCVVCLSNTILIFIKKEKDIRIVVCHTWWYLICFIEKVFQLNSFTLNM